jgi:hypothetical protein
MDDIEVVRQQLMRAEWPHGGHGVLDGALAALSRIEASPEVVRDYREEERQRGEGEVIGLELTVDAVQHELGRLLTGAELEVVDAAIAHALQSIVKALSEPDEPVPRDDQLGKALFAETADGSPGRFDSQGTPYSPQGER